MRCIKILLMLLVSLSVFAQYTVVLKNGLHLTAKKKPDFSKKIVEIVKEDGKKFILRADVIDLNATKKINEKKKLKAVGSYEKKDNITVKTTTAKNKNVSSSVTDNKKVFVINEKNFIKSDKTDKKKSKKNKSKSYSNISADAERASEYDSFDERSELEDKHGESYWRGVFAENKVKLDAAKNKLNKMEENMKMLASAKIQSTDTIYIMQITKEMNTLQEKIDKQKQVVMSLQREKEKLLERARREGALPGWYRDYE